MHPGNIWRDFARVELQLNRDVMWK